jgi:hypothetical protein
MAQDWRTVRVFISSTFKDMQAERDHLVRFVFPRLREELLKRRIHLVEVDLRWGVTSEQDALEVCKEIIDECRPRFVCILGGRYGWTPPGKHESITAGEVRHAILDHYLLNEYCFFYFRHPQVTASIPEAPARIEGYREYPSLEDIEAYCPEEAESRARRRTEKLKSLKQEVIDEGFIPCCYPARWDEAGGRLTDLSVFGEQVYQDLLWSIDDELGTEVPSELDEFAAEAAAVEAFIEERLAGYVVGSRQKVLDELTAFAESDGEPNVLVITGDAGTGKSAFLAKFYRDYVNKSPDCLVIPHFVGASVGSTDLRRTLRWMCHELSGAVGDKGEFPQDLQELLPKFSNLLQQSAASRRVVLIIDALNQIDAAENAHAMHWLPYQLPPNARIIVSTLEHLALDALRRREKRVRERTLEPLSENDSLAIVQGFLSRCHKEMTDRQVQALLSKRDSGNPLYLLAALEELRTLGTYEEITDRIKELPERVQDLFGWIFQRLEEDPGFRDAQGRHIGFELVRDLASLLAVSRYGLSQMELQELLAPSHSGAASPASPDPQGNVAALLRLLRPYLMHRVELLDFFHNQMREAAEAKYMQEESKRSAGHARLATYFRILSDPEHDESWKGTSSHAFSELPYHQTHAADWDNLMSTLESLFFLEGKIAHGLAFDIRHTAVSLYLQCTT